jgi:thioesterase-3
MHVLEFAVRPTELDSFGHVNNARYLEYLEWARSEWSIENGVDYDRFRALYIIPAVVEARLRFQAEARLGDRLRIETTPELVHAARILFRQEIRNQENRRVLRAEVSVVAVDTRSRTLTEFPEEFTRAIKRAEGKR